MKGVKKLALGTVQLGLEYGIANLRGKPSFEKALGILDQAYTGRIRVFDTAAAYGNAEEILGEWITRNTVGENISIISKLRPNALQNIRVADIPNVIEKELRGSLERLRRERLDGYLLHNADNLYNEETLGALEECKAKGLVKNIGVSIYEEGDALYAVHSSRIDYIQIPYNVLDRRLDQTDFFETARKNRVTVFARSAFLQGLLLMEEDEIPAHLKEVVLYLKKFNSIAKKHGFTRKEAAFLFPYTHPGIDYVVFGVDTEKQLDENIHIVKILETQDFKPCFKELKSEFLHINKSLILPNLWETRKPIRRARQARGK